MDTVYLCSARRVCARACVCVCSCFRTVRSLHVLTDGFSLIFYLMLQKIKLKLDDMLRLQFRREKKIKKLVKGSPYGRKERSKTLSGFLHKANTEDPFQSDRLLPPS